VGGTRKSSSVVALGLAVGITAAGYGAGAAVSVIPIQMMIAAAGYASTFYGLG
jgi:MFS transporter, OFA family, oxalate/formate antiporter